MTHDQIKVIESVCNAYTAANFWGYVSTGGYQIIGGSKS